MLDSGLIYGAVGRGAARFGPTVSTFLAAPPPLGATDLCRVMTRHGSDKGDGWHNYTGLYAGLLAPMRATATRVFEVGIGSNNPAIPCAMRNGRPGASLRGWRDWFGQARVFGADVDREALFSEERIRTYYVDQTKPETIAAMWREIAVGEGGDLDAVRFDLIVDDGWHEFMPNATFLWNSWRWLRPGGIYVVEDVRHDLDNQKRWLDFLPRLGLDALFVRLPSPGIPANGRDNAVILLGRPA